MAREYLSSHGIDVDAEMNKIQFGELGLESGSELRPPSSTGEQLNQLNSCRQRAFDSPDLEATSNNEQDRIIEAHNADTSGSLLSGTVLPRAVRVEMKTDNHIILIRGARLPRRPLLWDLHIEHNEITGIEPHDFNSVSQAHKSGVLEARGRLVCPSPLPCPHPPG